MNKSQVKSRVIAVRNYLEAIERPVSSVQGYEVVARALGAKNRHALAGGYEPEVMEQQASTGGVLMLEEAGQPLSRETLTAQPNGVVSCIVPVPFDKLGDIDEFNDYVSERITGSIIGLEDIGFEAAKHFYGPRTLAIKVAGRLTDFGLDDSEDSAGQRLAKEIEMAVAVRIRSPGGASVPWTVWRIVYKDGEGLGMLGDDEPDETGVIDVFEYDDAYVPAYGGVGTFVSVNELRGATRDAEGYWVTPGGSSYMFLAKHNF